MARTKNNNGLFIGIAVAVVAVIAIVVAVVVINKNKGGDGNNGGTSAVEYNTVDETIVFGDYDGMVALSKDIQNGNATGKIVKIEGIVAHPLSTYSIVQENADGTQRIGTEFILEGADDASYPADSDRIVITGEVVEKSPMYFVIKTTPNNIEMK